MASETTVGPSEPTEWGCAKAIATFGGVVLFIGFILAEALDFSGRNSPANWVFGCAMIVLLVCLLPIALLFTDGVIGLVFDKLGGRRAAALGLIASAVLVAWVLLGHRTVLACAIAAWVCVLSLHLGRKYLFPRREILKKIVARLVEFAIIFGATSTVLLAFTFLISRAPPQSIFDVQKAIECEWKPHFDLLEKVSLWALIIVGVLSFGSDLSKWGKAERRWNLTKDFHASAGRLTTAITVLLAFSFTLTFVGDGPLREIDIQEANALRQYRALEAELELYLGKDVAGKLRIRAREALGVPERKMLTQEASVARQERWIPKGYFASPTQSYPASQRTFLFVAKPGSDEANEDDLRAFRQWNPEQSTIAEIVAKYEGSRAADTLADAMDGHPLPGTQLRDISAMAANVSALQAENNGKKADVDEAVSRELFIELVTSNVKSEHLPLLKEIAERHPLAASLMDIVVLSLQEPVLSRIHDTALRLLNRLKGRAQANAIEREVDRESTAIVDAVPGASPSQQRLDAIRVQLASRQTACERAAAILASELAPLLAYHENKLEVWRNALVSSQRPPENWKLPDPDLLRKFFYRVPRIPTQDLLAQVAIKSPPTIWGLRREYLLEAALQVAVAEKFPNETSTDGGAFEADWPRFRKTYDEYKDRVTPPEPGHSPGGPRPDDSKPREALR